MSPRDDGRRSDNDRSLAARKPVLESRSRALQAVCRFFVDRGFIDVETPVRLPSPALELHIDAEPSGDQYLRTSPELHMKRLLAAGYGRIFQMGPCFRRGEKGRFHRPEYTMLEWYRADAGYLDVLADTRALLLWVAESVLGRTSLDWRGHAVDLALPWECWSVEEAFLRFAGWNPVVAYDADRFDVDLVEKVEPGMPPDRPVVLKDYPLEAAALARCRVGPPTVAERWEVYIGGVELANAFSELTDAAEQRRRFVECAEQRRRMAKEIYPLDEEFMAAMEAGLPPCAGVALGIDRLVMLMTDAATIDEVRAF